MRGLAGRGQTWHSDNTFMPVPPMGSLLRAVILPEVGGDTLWANMYLAYESLPKSIQRLCGELVAEHDLTMSVTKAIRKGHRLDLAEMQEKWPPVRHPVVRVHPETGRKALLVNRSSTTRIVGLDDRENEALLPLLQDAVRSPEFQVRLKWRRGRATGLKTGFVTGGAVPTMTRPGDPGIRRERGEPRMAVFAVANFSPSLFLRVPA